MFSQLKQRIKAIQAQQLSTYSKGQRRGLKKKVYGKYSGAYFKSHHPIGLGSALTHPLITTDYAESLLELITPPCQSSIEAYQCLLDIETYVYQHIGQ